MNTSCEKPQLIPSSSPYKEKIKRIQGTDACAEAAARERQQRLAKPAGSLGLLEDIAVQYAGITGRQDSSMKKGSLQRHKNLHGSCCSATPMFGDAGSM